MTTGRFATVKPILHPYPETKVEWADRGGGAFSIKTPWVMVNGSVDNQHVDSIEEAFEAVNNFDRSPNREKLANYFLWQFAEYPIYHSRLRKKTNFPYGLTNSFSNDVHQ